jgi:hypothetical protein
MLFRTAYLIAGGTVNVLKHVSNEVRPDGTSKQPVSRPYMTAFMGANIFEGGI